MQVKTLYGYGIIFLLLLFVKCTEDKVGTREWPRLNTMPVTDITVLGAQFNADFTLRGDFQILSYGFVWSTQLNPSLEASDKVVFSGSPAENSFSAKIETNLDDIATIYVRSFVETADYTVYGETVNFISRGSGAPNVISFTPPSGKLGDKISIVGRGFSYIPQRNKVEFANLNGPRYSDSNAAEIISSSDTLLVVKVPLIEYETFVKINVTIYHWTGTSAESFRYNSSK
jgi:hypothetical protein